MENEDGMLRLIAKLKQRNNKSYKFFEGLLTDLKDESKSVEAMDKLLSCYPITQYGGFTYEEDKILGEIIDSNLPGRTGNKSHQ